MSTCVLRDARWFHAILLFLFIICGSICTFIGGWLGCHLFIETALQLVNLFYTSLMILMYGVYDMDVAVEYTIKYPLLYKMGILNICFNVSVIVLIIFIIHLTVSVYVTNMLFMMPVFISDAHILELDIYRLCRSVLLLHYASLSPERCAW